MLSPTQQRLLGVLGLLFYAVHVGLHATRGEVYNGLWICHVGCLLVGLSLIQRQDWYYAVGLMWLVLGLPFWLLDLASGGELVFTSTLTHLGGLAIAAPMLRLFKPPPYSWLVAVFSLLLLAVICRVVTPPAANVNLAFAVWQGWEGTFTSYPLYAAMMLALAAGVFFLVELGLKRLGGSRA